MPEKFRLSHQNGLDRVVIEKDSEFTERTIELAGFTKGQREFPVELSLARWKTVDGLFFTGIIRDITERKQIEEELKKHRENLMELVNDRTFELQKVNKELEQEIGERIRAEKQVKHMALFAELSPSPVLRYDINGTILMANPAATEILGNGYLDGISLSSIIPDIEGLDFAACIRDGTILSHYAQIKNRYFHFIFRGLPKLGIGQIYGSDITDQKKAEADTLRASHLAALGELAAGVAHEINNPINGIINYTQMLANKSKKDSKEHDIARRIINEGDRIANIVRSLLTFARDAKEERRTVHINEIISDSLALIETQIKKDGIKLNINIPEQLPEVTVQPQQIEQVFLNLLSNSRYALNQKFYGSHNEKILDIIGEEVIHKHKPYIRITFHDKGIGIPYDIMDKVMNPFFSTKPSGIGTGLGLSISHGIITDHGGRINIESQEGEFTKVLINLPVRKEVNAK
jgi:signal transduction histidine kinase